MEFSYRGWKDVVWAHFAQNRDSGGTAELLASEEEQYSMVLARNLPSPIPHPNGFLTWRRAEVEDYGENVWT
jgi:hypothetical protein